MITAFDIKTLNLVTQLAQKILGKEAFIVNIDVDYDEDLDVEAQLINVGKNEFEITLRPDVENLRTAIAHELIHVKQYVEGRLAETNLGMFWEGKFIDTNKVGYIDLPWEVEAHELEGNY